MAGSIKVLKFKKKKKEKKRVYLSTQDDISLPWIVLVILAVGIAVRKGVRQLLQARLIVHFNYLSVSRLFRLRS